MPTLLPSRYTNVELVAGGGMGEVYRATDQVLGRIVAVKLLSERHGRDPDVRERFTREALAAARLSAHPNVVTVFDVGEHEGRPYIVMEYLERGSLHDRVRRGGVPPNQALVWLAEAAAALDAAHASGIVHRDVKPANLLFDAEDRIHVTDFGIALAAGSDTLTVPGTVLGTVGYLAPEQARGEPATAASDRYALAVVAFELLAGTRPFASETAVTEAFAHVNAPVPSIRSLRPDLPPELDAVFDRGLAKDPGRRPRTARDLVADLRRPFEVSEEPTVVLAARKRVGPARRLGGLAVGVPLGLALLFAGVAAAALLGAGGDAETQQRTITSIRTIVSTGRAETLTVTETEEAVTPVSAATADGAALNDQGFALLQEGEYEAALPLLEQAVAILAGTGSLAEAYASYNLAVARLAVGECDGVVDLLDRSEAVQGHRGEIVKLRKEAERTCSDDSPGHGKKNDDE